MLPDIPDAAAISDPVLRNRTINETYHLLNLEMDGWLHSSPSKMLRLSNWCSFGKFASREVGEQLRELCIGAHTLHNLWSLLSSGGEPLRRAVRDVLALPKNVPLFSQLFELAKQQAGVPEQSLLLLELGSIRPVANQLLASLRRLRDQLIAGNLRIYQNIARKIHQFLATSQFPLQGQPGPQPELVDDPRGFLRQAFANYCQAKALTETSELAQLRRAELVHQANLLIGVQEQLIILQPCLELVRPELKALTRHITLTDPLGTQRILPNGDDWGDFYQRMGFATDAAPELSALGPDSLPPLWQPEDPRYVGTIGAYFVDGLRKPELISERARPLHPVGMGTWDVLMDDSWSL